MLVHGRRHVARLAILVATGMALATQAQAAETITLTSISGYPPAASWVKAFREAFMPSVDATLAKTGKYKIAWNEGFSGNIVKPRGELEGIQSGIGDMGLIPTLFHADKLPFHKLTFVTPFTSNDLGVVIAAMNDLEKEVPAIAKSWDAVNQVNLVLTGAVSNYLIWSKTPIKSIGDMKGMKIGAGGANIPWVSVLGATGVSTNLADAYNSLNTGIYEAVILTEDTGKSFKICEPAPYIFDGGMGAAQTHNVSVNKGVWAKLPAEVKQAMTEAAQAHRATATRDVVAGSAEGVAWCKANHKTEVFKPTAEEKTKWVTAMNNDAKAWAAELERAGLPGNAVLTAYMNRLRAANQPIARHWDRD